ncbi:conserved hypothetical protein [Methylocella tundrae]|uniref:DUF2946 domain-containing protein n=1 Tax=Methylocella tundrae TaxID=227605 RepID=A0A4V6IMZ2_METTU|nr:conserved protein of unknown function [Methylocella tundrae]VTZ27696.1 conserved hypothetical protein [Methylocella tundrae]VTZ50206.1 conserved hypothetical protein [Methylocella tundrae]
MTGRLGRLGNIGRIAACVAAYALVLQVVLTSALAASIPAAQFSGLGRLCLSSNSSPSDGESGHLKSHCPLCVLRVAAAALPPPPPTPIIDRIAVEFHFRAVLRSSLRVFEPRSACQPRAPPAQA